MIDGYLYTSSDSGANWTELTAAGSHSWVSISSSSDGARLAAVVKDGSIYTSIDFGVTWAEQTDEGSRNWKFITSSSDGAKLAAIVIGGSIWTGYLMPDGSLQVSLLPQEAITAGAQWQVDGDAWQGSGAVVTGLSIGEHALTFKSITNWTSPANQTITIVEVRRHRSRELMFIY